MWEKIIISKRFSWKTDCKTNQNFSDVNRYTSDSHRCAAKHLLTSGGLGCKVVNSTPFKLLLQAKPAKPASNNCSYQF